MGTALLVTSPALAAPQVNGTFSVPGLTDSSQVVQGPDGNMWATTPDAATNDVSRISSQTGQVTAFDFTDANLDSPVGITRQGSNLWVTAINNVGKFTPANPVGAVATNIAAIGSPRGITLGPDGNLWAVSDNNVIKIPPAAPNTATSTAGLITGARQVVSGAGNTLWATGGTQVIHFTTAPAQAAGSPYELGGGPQGIAAGPGAQVAFGNPVNSPQQIGRITPPGAPQLTNLGSLDAGFGVVFGNDGAYWLGQYNGNDLRRFTPEGQSTLLGGFPAAPNRGPRYLAKGPNDTLWVNLDVPGTPVNDRVARVTGVTPPSPLNGCTNNEFELGKAKKKKRKGTAKLPVEVPCAGTVELAKTKKVKADEEVADAEGEVKLLVKSKGKARKRLNKKGKAKVKAEVTYTPDGGEPNTQTKKLKLKRKRR